MKKVLFVLLTLLFIAGTTQGQGKGKMALSIGADVAIPMGDFTDAADLGTGFGGTAKFEYGVSKNLVIMGTVGYLTWSGSEVSYSSYKITTSISAIPVFAGVKYYFGKTTFYAMGELGLHFMSFDVDVAGVPGLYSGGSGSTSESEFGFGFGAGYEIKVGKSGAVDLCAKYVIAASDFSFVDIRVGYKFALGK